MRATVTGWSRLTGLAGALLMLATGCARDAHDHDQGHAHDHAPGAGAGGAALHHEHVAPHGGTPVVLGDEAYHLELVRDAATDLLQVFVLDGEMERFIRSSSAELEIVADVAGGRQVLVLRAVADTATGETVGDSSLFEGTAEWLRSTPAFDATLTAITIRGVEFADVQFNFPGGNEAREEPGAHGGEHGHADER